MKDSALNRIAWDKIAKRNSNKQLPNKQLIQQAKIGRPEIYVTPETPIPFSWYPNQFQDKCILCLAAGGGEQGPLLALTGAKVTVYDISDEQLQKDISFAQQLETSLQINVGDMRDLSVFSDQSFDLIIHPWSNCYVETIEDVWKECYRVLKQDGVLISGFANPVQYIFDQEQMYQGTFTVRHSIPYADVKSLTSTELKQLIEENQGVIFGHTLHDQIQGQIQAGFIIDGFFEDRCKGRSPLDPYIPTAIATKATKLR